MNNKNFRFYFLFIVIVYFLYINNNKVEGTPNDYYFWANLLYWLFLTPLILFFFQTWRKEIFPFLGLVGFFLLLSYCLPLFFISPTSYQLGDLSVESLKWTFWAYFIFFLSYYLFDAFKFLRFSGFNPISEKSTLKQVKAIAYVFLTFYTISSVVKIASFGKLGDIGIYIYLGIFLLLINKLKPIHPLERVLYYLVFIQTYFNTLTSGLISSLALLTLFIVIINFFSAKNIVRANFILIPFMISYIIISPVKSVYREDLWFSGRNYSALDRINSLVALIDEYKDFTPEKQDKDHPLWRFSYQASAFSLVLEKTPDVVPFWNGESYKIFSKFIPRFLWPGKPEERLGYDFGVRYYIMDVSNNTTSMNTPLLGEMYMNFGFKGVFIGMILLALLYYLLNGYLNNFSISDYSKVICIALLFPLLIHESNFSLTFGNVPLFVFVVYLIVRIVYNSVKN